MVGETPTPANSACTARDASKFFVDLSVAIPYISPPVENGLYPRVYGKKAISKSAFGLRARSVANSPEYPIYIASFSARNASTAFPALEDHVYVDFDGSANCVKNLVKVVSG